jgi:ABC-type branched-subunit amino acid transport system permease subunit
MKNRIYFGLYGLIVILLILPFVVPNNFYLDLAVRMAINAIIVIGLNLLPGCRRCRGSRNRLPTGSRRHRWSG